MLDQLYSTTSLRSLSALALAASVALTLSSGDARSAAQGANLLLPGDSVVTGFSGTTRSPSRARKGQLIDLQGSSAQILSLQNLRGLPKGKLSDALVKHRITAAEVGQVFAIALDDGQDNGAPYIYLGSTSYFGLEIVIPARDGDGRAARVRIGHPDARWMAGQFGPNGDPGAIWRVNSKTGEVSHFASIPNNNGAGVGDIVFDQTTRQLFVSDLDSGLIYRIGLDGKVQGHFDHGTQGRTAAGFAPIADDGRTADITSSAFNATDPATWGYTQKHRRVAGMASHDGRLYYAVAGGPEIWSVAISEDGALLSDARLELKVQNLPGEGPITDMLFDREGRLYLAQRGEQRASDDKSELAKSGTSAVVRFRRGAPASEGSGPLWLQDGEDYAVGMMPGHTQANGGIALGYQHDRTGRLQRSAPDAMVWATGDRLRPSAPLSDATAAQVHSDVHGLQGTQAANTRPRNVPPSQAYYIDYDQRFGDPERVGHLGDVEIWQAEEGGDAPLIADATDDVGYEADVFHPPADKLPPGVPPEYTPTDPSFKTNLKLSKRAITKKCRMRPGGWRCRYKIKITNTGPDTYAGPIRIAERLFNPAGASLTFSAPWNCWTVGAGNYRCWRPNVVLPAGASVSLAAVARVPVTRKRCRLRNIAEIRRAPGGSRWNTNPADDRGVATAFVPGEDCKPPQEDDTPEPKTTNLSLKKEALSCGLYKDDAVCSFKVSVTNTGSNTYTGPLVVKDLPQTGAVSTNVGWPGWSCTAGSGNAYHCSYDSSSLAPGATVSFLAWTRVTTSFARENRCKMSNSAQIVRAPGGSVRNSDATDDSAVAIAEIPKGICLYVPPEQGGGFDPEPMPLQTNLKIEKLAGGACDPGLGLSWCTEWRVRVINTGPGPFSGVIKFRDLFPSGAVLTPVSSDLTCSGSQCETTGSVTLNASPASWSSKSFYLYLSGSARLARRLKCRVTNRVELISPTGVPNKNTDKSDDRARDTAQLDPEFCKDPTPSPNPVSNEPKVPTGTCRPGHTLIHGRCVREAKTCPRGLKKVSTSRVRVLRAKGWSVRRVGAGKRAIWCAKPGRKPNYSCRKGWKKVASKPRIPRHWKRYSVGTGQAKIWCVKKVRKPANQCRRPARWNGKTCVCPGHSQWNGKRCVAQKQTSVKKKTCKRGYVGRPPNCRKVANQERRKQRLRKRRARN